MAENTKTERILAIFHLLSFCTEVSYKEVTDLIPVSKKTVDRDVCLLREIGFQIEFSKKRGAFVMSKEKKEPCFPENLTRRKYREKILRLTDLMRGMEGADDPAVSYRERYPNLSARTMQRDFKILRSIGYRVEYQRGADEWDERRSNKYYSERPFGAFDDAVFELFKRHRS